MLIDCRVQGQMLMGQTVNTLLLLVVDAHGSRFRGCTGIAPMTQVFTRVRQKFKICFYMFFYLQRHLKNDVFNTPVDIVVKGVIASQGNQRP